MSEDTPDIASRLANLYAWLEANKASEKQVFALARQLRKNEEESARREKLGAVFGAQSGDRQDP